GRACFGYSKGRCQATVKMLDGEARALDNQDNPLAPTSNASVPPVPSRAPIRFASWVRTSTVPTTVSSLAIVVFSWWIWSLILHNAVLLPSPEAVAARFATLLLSKSDLALPRNIIASTVRVLIGWGAGVALGITFGVAMASNRWIKGAFD